MLDENVSDQAEVKSLFKSKEEREPIESSEKNVWLNRTLVTLVWGSIISGCLYLAGGGEVEVSSVAAVSSSKSHSSKIILFFKYLLFIAIADAWSNRYIFST